MVMPFPVDMPTSSLSAAIAIGTSSYSLSSVSPNYLLSLHVLPRNKGKPVISKASLKFTGCANYSSLSSPFRPFVFCASSALDDVELSQEEDEEIEEEKDVQSSAEESVFEEEEDVKSSSAEASRLYVGNLPFSMTSKQLFEIFAEAGRVMSVEIVYDRVTDRSRGFSFVTMGSVEDAKVAIRLFDGAQIGGRTAKVNFPEVPRGGEREVMAPKIRSTYQGFVDSTYKIYAGNLSWDLTSHGLREAFEGLPGFLSAKVINDKASGRSRGFGFITFASELEVESALDSMNGMEVEGRPLRLNLAEQRAPTSSPSAVKNTSQGDAEKSEILSSISK